MFQTLYLIAWRLFRVWTSLFGIMNQYDPSHDLKINVGHCDLYFMVQWCVNFILGEYRSVWLEVWPENKCMTLWPIFHGQLILPYISKTIWWMSVVFSDNEKVWPKSWPKNKYRSTWPIFLGLVILLNILKIICLMNIIIGIMDQCDTKIDLIKFM